MSFYGKAAAGLVALTLAGGGAAYIASVGGDVMSMAQAVADEMTCYIIREYNGGAALFREGDEQPLVVYHLPADGVNAADMEMLKNGIRLRSMDEVLRLLEDLDIESDIY
ncbi:MAG: hypothetical protein IJZ95_01590 [Oscillospiraceae bacterium]|nr:hypothetical protein [Oscillospiraceae bacterium]